MINLHIVVMVFVKIIYDQGKHETIRYIIYNIMDVELCPVLELPQLEHLYEKLAAIPFTQYDQPTFGLLRALSAKAIRSSEGVYTISTLANKSKTRSAMKSVI